MELPIIAYGDPLLRRKCDPVEKSEILLLKGLIDNMFETMKGAQGVGLAAPQIGLSKQLFVVDASAFADDDEFGNPSLEGFKKVFINPIILEEYGQEWKFQEGCLSIPGIREEVERKAMIKIQYTDEQDELHREEVYEGIVARIIQHEFDHIQGKLFIDYLSPFKKKLIGRKINNITKGKVNVDYRMKFYSAKGK